MMINCCKDCKERYLACHDKCEKYLKQKEEYKKYKKEYDEQKSIDVKLRNQALHRYRSLSTSKNNIKK